MTPMIPERRPTIRHATLSVLTAALLLSSCVTSRAEVHWNVYVESTSAYTDQIGPQIVSSLKQQIARSVSLRLTNQAAGSQFFISIVTVDEAPDSRFVSRGSAAVIITPQQPGAIRPYHSTASAFSALIGGGLSGRSLLLDQMVGTCTAAVVERCAGLILAKLTLAISAQMGR